MAVPSVGLMRCRLAFAVIGVIVGLSILICFGVSYRNYNTALWGGLSGIFAGATLWLHIMYRRGYLIKWVPHLRTIMLTGCFIQLAGICGFVAYIVLAATLDQKLTPYDDGYYLTSVWCFMTWKWGFMLFYFSRSYRRLLTSEEYHPLTNSVDHGTESNKMSDQINNC